jgi:hypothetical protein
MDPVPERDGLWTANTKPSGSGNASGSRFAAASMRSKVSPARMVWSPEGDILTGLASDELVGAH